MIKAKEELDSIFWFPRNRISHFYFIKRDDGHYDLIDTCAPVLRPVITQFLSSRKSTLKRLLLTHSHPDHAGNAGYLTSKFHCGVYAHAREIPYLRGEAFMKKRDYTGINPFGRVVQLGDWLYGQPICKTTIDFNLVPTLNEEYDFIPLHGHTPGSTGILHKKTKSLFLGDAIVNAAATYLRPIKGLKLPYRYFSEDYEMALESVKTLHEVDFENAFFGHGDPIIGGARDKILEFLRSQGLLC